MFGWQLMALKSADIAGVKAKPDVWAKMISFLKSRSLGEHSGLAGYNLHPSTRHPTPAMTAVAPRSPPMASMAMRTVTVQAAGA